MYFASSYWSVFHLMAASQSLDGRKTRAWVLLMISFHITRLAFKKVNRSAILVR